MLEASLFPFQLFAVGGEAQGVALASVERFDLSVNSWQAFEPLQVPRPRYDVL